MPRHTWWRDERRKLMPCTDQTQIAANMTFIYNQLNSYEQINTCKCIHPVMLYSSATCLLQWKTQSEEDLNTAVLPHVVQIRKDEGLVDIKTTGDDVFSILHSVSITVFLWEIFPQVFLIIGHLDDQRNIEYVLKPSTTQRQKSGPFPTNTG